MISQKTGSKLTHLTVALTHHSAHASSSLPFSQCPLLVSTRPRHMETSLGPFDNCFLFEDYVFLGSHRLNRNMCTLCMGVCVCTCAPRCVFTCECLDGGAERGKGRC